MAASFVRSRTLRAGVDEEFVTFVRDSAPALGRYAYLLTGNQTDAEDLVQDALVRLCKNRDRVLNALDPVSYACRVVSNEFISRRRRRSSSEVVVAEIHGQATTADDPAATILARDELRDQLLALPERQRVAVVLRYYRDAADDEIADAIGAPVGTVRSLISRGLAAIRRHQAGGTESDTYELPPGGDRQ